MLRPFLAHTILALAALAAVPPLAGGTLVPAMPQTIPSCTAPQPLNLPQPAGIGGGASMAYNGTDFAAAYSQNGAIRFRRFFSDGSPAAPEQFVGSAMTFIPSAGEYTRPSLAWDGAGYGVAWFAQVDGFAVPMSRP